jgi:hypothetical protein
MKAPIFYDGLGEKLALVVGHWSLISLGVRSQMTNDVAPKGTRTKNNSHL